VAKTALHSVQRGKNDSTVPDAEAWIKRLPHAALTRIPGDGDIGEMPGFSADNCTEKLVLNLIKK